MLALIVLIVAGSQIIVGFFKNTTEELIIEYHELHAVQEFKMSLSNLLIYTNSLTKNEGNNSEVELNKLLRESKNKLDTCKQVLTISHKLSLLADFESIMSNVENAVDGLFQSTEEERESIYKLILFEINAGIRQVDLLVEETKAEIEKYENRNQIVIRHGSSTVVSVGIILIMILAIGGWRFIRSLTNPINELVTATQRISKGDKMVKVNVNSNDEFLTLADSFNNMINALDETMISKNYLNNILENMFDPLIVTDENGIIRSINTPSLKLLGYENNDLINQDIMMLFNNAVSEDYNRSTIESILNSYQQFINKQKYFLSKKGKLIPALMSCTFLKNQKKELAGLIVVGHDLTERQAFEKKLEFNRKEQQIAINEAQEDERLRIAIDLHDGLGQMLSAISYSVQNINKDDAKDNDSILKIQNQIDSAIWEAKNIAHNLIPIVLKDFGLIAAIENMINKANELYETKFRFNSYDFTDRIDAKLEKAIYRICQESLTNIVKHASAKNAIFQLFRSQGFVVLVIEDDGIGFDTKKYDENDKKTSIGLVSIRERASAFDGVFSYDSQVGKGTELIIEIPCRKK